MDLFSLGAYFPSFDSSSARLKDHSGGLAKALDLLMMQKGVVMIAKVESVKEL